MTIFAFDFSRFKKYIGKALLFHRLMAFYAGQYRMSAIQGKPGSIMVEFGGWYEFTGRMTTLTSGFAIRKKLTAVNIIMTRHAGGG
jgi:hypothetical protein